MKTECDRINKNCINLYNHRFNVLKKIDVDKEWKFDVDKDWQFDVDKDWLWKKIHWMQ